MIKLILGAIALFLLLLAMLGVASACVVDNDMDKTQELQPVEIREYEGNNLSSIDDFRENSINGPQQVDIEGYQLKITGLVENPTTHNL